jgi:hypothetical protein
MTHLDGPIDICSGEGITFRNNLLVLIPDLVFYTLWDINPVLIGRMSSGPKEYRVVEGVT